MHSELAHGAAGRELNPLLFVKERELCFSLLYSLTMCQYVCVRSVCRVVAMLVPEYWREKVGELVLFIGPTSVGES